MVFTWLPAERCCEVIGQHSITGGRSVFLHAHVMAASWVSVGSCRGGFHEEDGLALKYHHLVKLPSWLTVCVNKEWEKILMSCEQIYLFPAFYVLFFFFYCTFNNRSKIHLFTNTAVTFSILFYLLACLKKIFLCLFVHIIIVLLLHFTVLHFVFLSWKVGYNIFLPYIYPFLFTNCF